MNIVITKRGQMRIDSTREYIERKFYPEYGRAFEDDVIHTISLLEDNPDLGEAAFKELNRPELRRILCANHQHFIYYRHDKKICEILSVRHTLMDIRSPRQL